MEFHHAAREKRESVRDQHRHKACEKKLDQYQ